MPLHASPELYWLTLATLATAIMWVPYTLSLIAQMGLFPALGDTQHETQLVASWARRAKQAHSNAIENHVLFAALALAIHVLRDGTDLTATACAVFFASRMAHWVVYVAGIPVIRTLLFAVGFACQIILALSLLGAI